MEGKDFEPVDTSKFPKTVRVMFDFAGDAVRVRSKRHVNMIAPTSPAAIPDDAVGTWVELVDSDGATVFQRLVYDPFQTRVEHYSPDGRIEAFDGPFEYGEFEVLVPLMDEAARGVLKSRAREEEDVPRSLVIFDLEETDDEVRPS